VELVRRFDPAPRTVRDVREFVSGVIDRWALAAGDAELLASELATNAVLHARTPYEVVVSTVASGGFRVAVHDDDPTPPVPGVLGSETALDGRGVALVVNLAKRWGCDRIGGGKTVWFEL
jgi:hypothetical protein